MTWQFYAAMQTTTALPHSKLAELPALINQALHNCARVKATGLTKIMHRTIKAKPHRFGLLEAYTLASEKTPAEDIRRAPRAMQQSAPPPRNAGNRRDRGAQGGRARADRGAPNICRDFNKGRCTRAPGTCRFAHVCMRCYNPSHAVKDCRTGGAQPSQGGPPPQPR